MVFSTLVDTRLYVAPAAMGDFCDSSGCLPGQIPLPGLKAKPVINQQAELTMNQVPRRIFSLSDSMASPPDLSPGCLLIFSIKLA